MKKKFIEYRPEIDGLRAIAVSAVIIYHAQIRIFDKLIFSGGFLGVDIFFVISGYLITFLILKENQTNNNFSIKNFYERRARRILPALLMMLVVMFPLAYFVLIPSDLKEYAISNLFSISFISNYFFYFSETEYGTIDSFLKPLLHTWSLGVEEQFYIFFPFLMLFFLNKKRSLKSFILSFLFLSFLLSSYVSVTNKELSFFSLPTRIWELFFGSIVAYLIFFNKLKTVKKNILNLLSNIGFLLIILSFIFFEKNTYHPSYFTLIPIMSTCFIILNFNSTNLVKKFLSMKLIVFTGLISYSLYLYHYPIFSFSRYFFYATELNQYEKIFILFIIFFASYLSYYFIEKPFRDQRLSFKKFIGFIFISIFLITSLSILILNNKIENKKFNIVKQISLDNKSYKNQRLNYPKNYKFKNNKINLTIIGDSHASDTYIIFNEFFKNNDDFNLILLTTEVRCLINIENKKLCEKKLNNEKLDILQNSDYLILSTSWNQKDINNLDKIIELINNEKNKLIITSSSPTYQWTNMFTTLDKYILKEGKIPSGNDLKKLEKKLFNEIPDSTFDRNIKIKNISKKNDLIFFDKFDYTCDVKTKRCKILTNENRKIYYDNSHYTLSGSFYFKEVIKKLGWFNFFR